MGLIKKISDALKKTRETWRRKLDSIMSHGALNDDFFDDLVDILISCDIDATTSMEIADDLRIKAREKKVRTPDGVKNLLKEILTSYLSNIDVKKDDYPLILTIIGVNGVGKTTTIGKLANFYKLKKKSVTLVAGDTFRAAACKQLETWAERNKVRIISQGEGSDAAAVVFDGVESAKAKKTDVLIVDTAGRLQTKINLMEELKKIDKVIKKTADTFTTKCYIVLDATTGQNALSQIKAFDEYSKIDGIILTKLDGTAKGGVVITIAKKYELPVVFVGTGEQIDDISEFNAKEFVDELF